MDDEDDEEEDDDPGGACEGQGQEQGQRFARDNGKAQREVVSKRQWLARNQWVAIASKTVGSFDMIEPGEGEEGSHLATVGDRSFVRVRQSDPRATQLACFSPEQCRRPR